MQQNTIPKAMNETVITSSSIKLIVVKMGSRWFSIVFQHLEELFVKGSWLLDDVIIVIIVCECRNDFIL